MRVCWMTAAAHDAAFARLSHLPHLAAALLMRLQRCEELPLAGRGLRDSTRIAAGREGLWTGICMTNRANLAAELEAFAAGAGELAAMLRRGDSAALEAFLAQGREMRQQLDAPTDAEQ